ncbi:MAG: hypothetical protein ABH821_05965 [archaeon]
MSLEIKTNLYPYRMVLSRKQPVELFVEVKNSGIEDKLVSMQLLLSQAFGLSKGGLNNSIEKQLGLMKPNESKSFYFDIHPKQIARIGEYPLRLKVKEHYQNYDYAMKEHVKDLNLKVSD